MLVTTANATQSKISYIGAFVGAQELNRDDTELKDKLINIALGAGAGGLLNLGLASVINKVTASFLIPPQLFPNHLL